MEGSFDLLKGLSTEVTSNKCWVRELVTPADSGHWPMGYDGMEYKDGVEQE